MEYYKGLINSLERGQVAPVYLFYGDEEYLKEKAVEQFKEHLLPQAADFNLDILDGEEAELTTVVALAENLPFMAERRLVLVKNAPWFKGKVKSKSTATEAGEEKSTGQESPLINYLSQPSPSTCLIFVTGDSVDKRKKLFKTVDAVGKAIEFKSLKAGEMTAWVSNRIKAGGKKIDAQAARALVEANGKLGLLNLANEVEKLITYVGKDKEISLTEVQQVGVTNLEQNIFTVVDDAVNGYTSKAITGIKELLALKEQPVKILAMLARQFRLAFQVEALVRAGCPEREVAGKLGLQDFIVRKALAQARKSSGVKLEWALQRLAAMDADIKKGQQEFLPAITNTLFQLRQK